MSKAREAGGPEHSNRRQRVRRAALPRIFVKSSAFCLSDNYDWPDIYTDSGVAEHVVDMLLPIDPGGEFRACGGRSMGLG